MVAVSLCPRLHRSLYGEMICRYIARIVSMAFEPYELGLNTTHFSISDPLQHFLNQVSVLYGFLISPDPTILLPVLKPFRNAFDSVVAVGIYLHVSIERCDIQSTF
jgi:hypothetical protein